MSHIQHGRLLPQFVTSGAIVTKYIGLDLLFMLYGDGACVLWRNGADKSEAVLIALWNVPNAFIMEAFKSEESETLYIGLGCRGSLTTSPRALLHKIELLSPDSKIDQVPKTIASIPLASAILPNTLTINEKTFAFATDNSSVTTFNYVTKEEVTFATSPEVSADVDIIQALKLLPGYNAVQLVKPTYIQRMDIPRVSSTEANNDLGIILPTSSAVATASISGGVLMPGGVGLRGPITIALGFRGTDPHIEIIMLRPGNGWRWTPRNAPVTRYLSLGAPGDINNWDLLTFDPAGLYLATSSHAGIVRVIGPVFGPDASRELVIQHTARDVVAMSLNDTSTKLVIAGTMRDDTHIVDVLH